MYIILELKSSFHLLTRIFYITYLSVLKLLVVFFYGGKCPLLYFFLFCRFGEQDSICSFLDPTKPADILCLSFASHCTNNIVWFF